jgi:hypothetical protein
MLTEAERTLIVSQFDKSEVVRLSEVAGRVVTPRDFAERSQDTLRPFERVLVNDSLGMLEGERLDFFVRPLAICQGQSPLRVEALRSGGRSALIASAGLYLKGCRPRPDRPELFFPSVNVDIETGVSTERRLPFGVLTAEGVIREILGYLVHRRNSWELARTPVAIFEYHDAGPTPGYCIVFSLEPGFRRIEGLLPKVKASLKDLLAAECVRTVTGLDLAPGQWAPAGCPAGRYADIKARSLAALHAKGCFRGFLNSNPGNDLLAIQGDSMRLALVDFDSFQALDLEGPLNNYTQERIVELGCVEAVKSQLPVFDFVITDVSDADMAFSTVEARVRSTTTSLALYEDMLRTALRGKGWAEGVIDAGYENVKINPLYRSCILDLVPNSFLLSTSYNSALSLYAEQLH